MKLSAKTISILVLLSTFILANSLSASEPSAYRESIVTVSASDFIAADKRYEIFNSAWNASGIRQTLKHDSHVIIFIISDRLMEIEGSAFLLRDVLRAPENRTRLVSIIGFHVYLGNKQSSGKLEGDQTLRMLSGECLDIQAVGNGLAVGGQARVTERHQVSNGTVYVVDRLLTPTLKSDRKRC